MTGYYGHREEKSWFSKFRIYLLVFAAGIAATYIFNFFYYTAYLTEKRTSYYIANAFNLALSDMIGTIMFLAVVAIVTMILYWWINHTNTENKRSLDEARRGAEKIKGAATRVAAQIEEDARSEAAEIRAEATDDKEQVERERRQLEIRRRDLEAGYQGKHAELEQKKQAYLDELEGLRRKNKALAEELSEARKAGTQKMRDEGNEGGAKREEKKLKKLLDELT